MVLRGFVWTCKIYIHPKALRLSFKFVTTTRGVPNSHLSLSQSVWCPTVRLMFLQNFRTHLLLNYGTVLVITNFLRFRHPILFLTSAAWPSTWHFTQVGFLTLPLPQHVLLHFPHCLLYMEKGKCWSKTSVIPSPFPSLHRSSLHPLLSLMAPFIRNRVALSDSQLSPWSVP